MKLAANTLAALAAILLAVPAGGDAQPVRLDTASLASGRHARMEMLLEKSIFNVNVLSLDLRLGRGPAAEVERLASGRRDSPALADSLASALLRSRNLLARVTFHRSFGFGRFVKGTRRNLAGLPRTQVADSATYRRISLRLPNWYWFLRGRGVREGDRMTIRVLGDTVRLVYRSATDTVLHAASAADSLRALSVPGRYFAPGSDFREPLIRSLLGPRGGGQP